MTEIITVDEARQRGLTRYFTGKPCKHGHVAERLTSNKTCMVCACRIWAGVYKRDAGRIDARARDYVLKNRAAVSAQRKLHAERNRERLCKYYSERYYRKKPEILAKVKAYKAARPGFSNEIGKAYVLRKSKAMPSWADRIAIRAIYAEAQRRSQETGVCYSVDHVYPLKGKTASGLHVPWNLQVITKIDNCRKAIKPPNEANQWL